MKPLPRHGRTARSGVPASHFLAALGGLSLGFLVCSIRQNTIRPGRPAPGAAAQEARADGGSLPPRKPLLAFVGVQTGFAASPQPQPKYDYAARRRALRAAWFPGSRAQLDRLEAEQGIVARFVIGRSPDAAQEAALEAEAAEHGDFWRLDLLEGYAGLPAKTVAFLQVVTQRYDPQYIVKVDDDVYFRLDRLPHAARQWAGIHADYVGCMKTGPIVKSPAWRWFEPQHVLLGGGSYFTHAWGSVYVLSGRVAADLAAMRPGSLRHFANEDVTIGSWLLAFNATHYDDRRLCEPACSETSLAVYDIPKCAGLCDAAAQLPQLHASPACRSPATAPDGALPLAAPLFVFDGGPGGAGGAG